MAQKTEIRKYVIARTADMKEALSLGYPCAQYCYRAGDGPRLLRQPVPVATRGGMMIAAADGGFSGEGFTVFATEVQRESAGRGFDGVMLDFMNIDKPRAFAMAREVESRLLSRKMPFFVPFEYSGGLKETYAMISSAVAGGSFDRMLEEAAEKSESGKLALEVNPVCMDFELPAEKGAGKELSPDAFDRLVSEIEPEIFFSRELCAKYFTYMDQKKHAHFVLFDDKTTVAVKLETAAAAGVAFAFAAYPDATRVF